MDYSPGLAIATACFEISVAVWALRGPGERTIIRTTGAILLLLATYQIIEVSICANVSAVGFLPQLAFIAVTWLPPIGLLLIAKLYRPRSRMLYRNAYSTLAVALGIVVWIALDRGFVSISVCTAVLARYTTATPRFMLYSGFYWMGLLGMILFSGYGVKTCLSSLCGNAGLCCSLTAGVIFRASCKGRAPLCHVSFCVVSRHFSYPFDLPGTPTNRREEDASHRSGRVTYEKTRLEKECIKWRIVIERL
jgi:hypothetical protein